MTGRKGAAWRRAFAVALAGVLLAVLTTSNGAEAAVPTLAAPAVPRAVPPPGTPVDGLAAGITRFGYDLGRLGASPEKNFVASPLSIAYAFAMARAGAHGETAAQLDRVFGFPPTGTDTAFNALTRQVVTAGTPPPRPAAGAKRPDGPPQPPIVCVANGLFPQRDHPIGEAFLRTLAAQYGAGVHPLDFGSPEAAAAINAWVRQQTSERIRRLFDRLPGDTKLVLANAVYLKADWKYSFGEAPTRDEVFTRADRGPVRVPMMHQTQDLRYATGPGWTAVELPYAGDQLAMWVLIPAAGRAPDALLAPDSLARVAAGLHQEYVDLALPRWDFATGLDLADTLGRLGLTAPFGAGADFSGIGPGLYVTQAVHRANITVDEWGTEAAAVTGLAFATSGRVGNPVPVRADRPFAFAIVHRPTGVPLFVGHVADPSDHADG